MPKVGILIDKPSFSAAREGRLLTGFEQSYLQDKCARAGLLPSDIEVKQFTDLQHQTPIIVTMGELPLQSLTGKKSIWKWHLSPLDCLYADPDGCKKVIPTFDFSQLFKEWHLGLYFEMALKRAATNATPGPWIRKEERYVLGPSPDEAVARLEALLESPPEWFSIDIETGRCQINTFGVAWTGSDALAIKVLPEGMPANAFHKLFSLINLLCQSEVPKVMQNGIYERTYLSRYGIEMRNFKHDTMCAMKFLWPELEKGLDNVGRIYTMEPYWKDDGRVLSEEGKQKDWGDIRDWSRHFTYNCRDSSNTLIAMHAQRKDLAERGLLSLYDNYIVKLFDATAEMGIRGLPLNRDTQAKLIAEYEARSAALVSGLSQEINPRSSKAKLKLLRDKGYAVPTKRKTGKESADEISLKKLRLKHPKDPDIKALLEIAGIEKALSSYLRVKTLDDSRIRFMFDPVGTETGRFSCSKDPWGGLNAQTMTGYVKRMIEWKPEEDRVFVEIDLRQAETRFVAFDACEETLLKMLARDEDIHRYVAADIYGKPMAEITHDERQLGKKSGHGANYSMGVTTFQESCLKEMDLVIDRRMAQRVLESYHKLFPGIKRWQGGIRETIYRERKLTNPLGRIRYFYGRADDSTYREAYAYRPQSTVPDIINHLMLHFKNARPDGLYFHLQCHDSLLVSCKSAQVESLANTVNRSDVWHPKIVLPAGQLVIPTEIKFGRCLGEMQKFKA